MDLFETLLELFSGGLTGAISNIILVIAVAFVAVKIKKFLKKKTFESSLQQAKDERLDQIKENQTKDNVQADSEKELDNWRKEVRDGRKKD